MSAISDVELSALVAEKVMRSEHLFDYPNYSTDMGFALDAALKVAWNIDIQAPDSDPMCRAKLLLRRPSTPEIAEGETVARALCFAALRAVGVDVQDDGGGG